MFYREKTENGPFIVTVVVHKTLPGLRRSDGCIPREVDESTRELKVSKGTAITINIRVVCAMCILL